MTVYVKEQGALIQKMGERLLVTKRGDTLMDLPVIHLTNLIIIGNVQVTTQALHMMLERGIDISYFSYGGRYIGHTYSDSSKNIFLRLEQYNRYMDVEKRLDMARKLIDNKIDNQMELIRSHRWKPEEEYPWKADLEKMEKYRLKLPKTNSANEILGIEGICSSIYFSSFGYMIKGDFPFNGRNRRPPKDPVNIILSLAYTFLTREVCNALDAESFETYLGFLHGIRYGRKSLALDLVEEFRQPAVDRLTLVLFGKRMIGRYDFDENEDGTISLNESGFRKFCTEYENWMTGKNSLAGDYFRKRIREQIADLKKSVAKDEEYHPYNWREHHVSHQL